jgi:signal transduction histidine kinase
MSSQPGSIPVSAPFTLEEVGPVQAFYAVLERVRERTDRDGWAAAARFPVFAAAFAKMDPALMQAERASRRRMERDAIVDQRWEGYFGSLAKVGATYAAMGVSFVDWFALASAFRPDVYDEILPPGSEEARTVLEGMDRFFDISVVTIGASYIEAKERLVREAESQRDLYVDLFRNSTLGMMIYEWSAPPDLGSFRAIAANPAAIAMFPIPADQILGFTIREARPEILETDVPGRYATAIERGESSTWTLVRESAVFDAQCFPLRGRFVGVMFEDVTERHRLTAAVERHGRDLERSNRDLDDFAYVASHDLKAPLRDIHNLASWIAEDAAEVLPAASARHLALLRERITRMEGLLDDLLAYSRADRVRPPPEAFDVGAVIEAALRLVGPHEGFEIVVSGDLPTIHTPRVPFDQVIRNLVTNSIKHHDRKQGRISIHVVAHEKHLDIAVTDDGPGIPAQFHERIFRMFQTLKPRDEVEGSGMGLAIVKKVVEAHGGAVKITSAPGEGTTMNFTWPRIWPDPSGAAQ